MVSFHYVVLVNLLITFCFSNFTIKIQAAKTVSASVTAPWLSIPQSYVMEAAEILSDAEQQGGKPSYFWDFLNTYENPNDEGDAGMPLKETYFTASMETVNKIIKNDHSVLSEVFRLKLDARAGSPSVELHSSIAKKDLKWNEIERKVNVCGEDEDLSTSGTAIAMVETKGFACNVNVLMELFKDNKMEGKNGNTTGNIALYDFDHEYDNSETKDSAIIVVLYGIIGENSFTRFHEKLVSLAKDGIIKYIVRHAPFLSRMLTETPIIPRTFLKGYGISLDLKSMEYKALDDRDLSEEENDDGDNAAKVDDDEDEDLEDDIGGFLFSRLISRRPDMEKQLKAFQKHLHVQVASDETSGEIKVWDMKDLGLQTANKVMSSKDKLLKLQSLSQNFPLHAKSLTRVRVKKSVRKAINKLHKYVNPGDNKMTLNGREINPLSSDFSYLQFLQSIQEEAKYAEQFKSLGFSATNVEKYSARLSVQSSNDDNVELLGRRIDVRTGAKGAVYFLNNIEKDNQYKSWPRQYQQLLQHAWHLITIRRNLYTGVFVIDPLTKVGLETIGTLFDLVDSNVPLRMGIVMVDSTSNKNNEINAGTVLKLLATAKKEHKQVAANAFLKVLSQYALKTPLKKEDLVSAYANGVAQGTGSWSSSTFAEEAEKCLNADRFDGLGGKVLNFYKSKGLNLNSYILNGNIIDGVDSIRQELMQHLFMEQQRLQRLVSIGKISGNKNVYAYLTGSSKKSTRRNSPWSYPRFHQGVMEETNNMEFTTMVAPSSSLSDQLIYFHNMREINHNNERKNTFLFTYFLVVDLNGKSSTGLTVLLSACEYLVSSDNTNSRFAIFDSSSSTNDTKNKKYIESMLKLFHDNEKNGDNAKGIIKALIVYLKEILSNKSFDEAKNISDKEMKTLELSSDASSNMPIKTIDYLKEKNILGSIVNDDNLLIVNGRVIRDVSNSDKTLFELIDGFERSRIVDNSKLGLVKINRYDSDTMMVATSIANQYMVHSRSAFSFLNTKNAKKNFKKNMFTCNPDSTTRLHSIALIDPLSDAGQRFTPILIMLRDVIKAKITVVLNPKTDISEFPIKNFYRYVGGNVDTSLANFRHMPAQHILTMKVFTPEHWVVMKKKAIDDLDNIRLDDQTMGSRTSVSAEFSLTSILVTGTCDDLTHMQPPNGLQLVLDSAITGKRYADTLVMKNLGYFQLRARPGVYNLRLARGRASKLYSIAPNDAPVSSTPRIEDGNGLRDIKLTIRSFSGSDVKLRVRKQPGMERRSLLAKIPTDGEQVEASDGDDNDEDEYYNDEEENAGLWGQITNIFGNKRNGNSNYKEATGNGEKSLDTIHVFSLASGHLYERLLRIMMLSVRKRTSGPIKFWLVENFLSPQFKESIQFMANEMGFDVGLVTYKWPSWLRRQTEKQRIIWGYKILFLDVLFPLNVPKIITVDADQVVRADLRELWEMDLEGAPYGYTPFCTSRKETLGFQFWREGYWKNHLQGKPYHISALYVVDLIRFRRMAAGDQLRAIYDNLSRDPNSLSNLDQDLPNYAQNQIPIFSLPQEWLWCQSWCSDNTLTKAKTIDLCNHPKTKEAKLDMARRIISGKHFKESWVELDEEVAKVIDLARIEGERTCKSGDKSC